MKRNKIVNNVSWSSATELEQRTAYHESGHAAGIYLNNRTRGLPPVAFKIVFDEDYASIGTDFKTFRSRYRDFSARIDGGRFTELVSPFNDLPIRELIAFRGGLAEWERNFKASLEADVVNLLIGPLAEARFVAENDDELFNCKLVNFDALQNYGGCSDVTIALDYLQYLSSDKQLREEIKNALFFEAFEFVDNNKNWFSIKKLAEYILNIRKYLIDYGEIGLTLEQAATDFQLQKSQIARHYYPGGLRPFYSTN